MAYADRPSAGTKLEVKLSTNGVLDASYTEIPGCTDISHEGFKRGVRQPTHLSSPNVVKRPGMADFGQIKAKVFYDPNNAEHQAIVDQLQLSAAEAYNNLDDIKITYADGMTNPANAEYEGFFSEFSVSATDPETGTVTADMTFEITDIIAYTPGS